MNLCINLDATVLGYHVVWDRHALVDGYTLIYNRIVFHTAIVSTCRNSVLQGRNKLGHAQHAINLGDAQPVQYIRHQSLEPHILGACNHLGALKVFAGSVGATLSSIVDQVLCHFAQCSAFFAKVDDHAATAFLCFFYRFFDAKYEIGSTCAYVGAKDLNRISRCPS